MPLDKAFVRSQPFGVIKTLHWVASFALLLTLYLSAFMFEGVGFVTFVAWNAFFFSFLTWLCHIFALQKHSYPIGNSGATRLVVPFLFMDFLTSIAFFVLYAIATLILVVCIFVSLRYRIGVILSYVFGTAFSFIATAVYGYYAILVYRNTPNGQISRLYGLYTDGEIVDSMLDNGAAPATGPGPHFVA